jgi:hypothetical protein
MTISSLVGIAEMNDIGGSISFLVGNHALDGDCRYEPYVTGLPASGWLVTDDVELLDGAFCPMIGITPPMNGSTARVMLEAYVGVVAAWC